MNQKARFTDAIQRFDAVNQEDPRTDLVDGRPVPRELRFSRRVYEWIEKLIKNPSEELLLAARAHTLRRWAIPRDQYPRTTIGYHQWRDALARFHAEEARTILKELAFPEDQIEKVEALITRKNWPGDEEARALEDADCLAFLELKLHRYVEEWDQGKALHILQSAFRKMTAEGRTLALQLKLGPQEQELVRQAAE